MSDEAAGFRADHAAVSHEMDDRTALRAHLAGGRRLPPAGLRAPRISTTAPGGVPGDAAPRRRDAPSATSERGRLRPATTRSGPAGPSTAQASRRPAIVQSGPAQRGEDRPRTPRRGPGPAWPGGSARPDEQRAVRPTSGASRRPPRAGPAAPPAAAAASRAEQRTRPSTPKAPMRLSRMIASAAPVRAPASPSRQIGEPIEMERHRTDLPRPRRAVTAATERGRRRARALGSKPRPPSESRARSRGTTRRRARARPGRGLPARNRQDGGESAPRGTAIAIGPTSRRSRRSDGEDGIAARRELELLGLGVGEALDQLVAELEPATMSSMSISEASL